MPWARQATLRAVISMVPAWRISIWPLLKNLRLSEAKSLQFRLEGFNVFNHAQFFGPQAVDGNISSATLGQVVSATAPRLVQAGAKFTF